MEEGGDKALLLRKKDENDQEGLPLDLVLLIIALLPSRQLFDLRHLCRAARRPALLALARRPFFVVQHDSPSSLCYLIPLDAPCSPLPCSFKLAEPSFRIFSGSGNLLCLHSHNAQLLDICVCDIFRKWKTFLPPIVHPSYAPHITARVFIEDVDVEHMQVIAFHAAQPTINTDEEGVFSRNFRIFAASSVHLRVFDSQVNQWSDPVHFLSHLCLRGIPERPLGFATSDGNLILTFLYRSRVRFNYEDRSFEVMEHAFPHPKFEIAGHPASAKLDLGFNLRVRFPHVEECSRSIPRRGLLLEGVCETDVGCCFYYVDIDGVRHHHVFSRTVHRSVCHAYKDKLYVLVMERDDMECHLYISSAFIQASALDSDVDPLPPPVSHRHVRIRPWTSTGCKAKQWHDLHALDVKICSFPEEAANTDSANFFVEHLPPKLTLFSAHIDTRDWTMKVSKEADALACLDLLAKEGKVSFISGCVHAEF